MKNAIPIFCASDNKYVQPLSVLIISVLENTSSDVHFYILENQITEENKRLINKLKKKYQNLDISWLPIDIKKFENFPDLQWYSLNMYSRFLIPEICPQLDKVIYLDVDIVFKSDILELYEQNLVDYCLGAVPGEADIVTKKEFQQHIEDLQLSTNHRYFGSGVLLINSKKWREEKNTKKLLQMTEKFKSILKYPDQDVLNIVFNQAYLKLNIGYNRDLKCLVKDINEKIATISDVKLIHYDGRDKPWNVCDMPFSGLFWKYAKLSPFYADTDKKLQKGKTIINISFLFISLFSIVYDSKLVEIFLFKKLPFIKIKQKRTQKKVYLFNFIPLIKIK